jgi:hypothetical protein
MLRPAVAEFAGELESVTCTVNVEVPACVGIPEIWPAEEREIPEGNEPCVIDQLYGALPPDTVKDAE